MILRFPTVILLPLDNLCDFLQSLATRPLLLQLARSLTPIFDLGVFLQYALVGLRSTTWYTFIQVFILPIAVSRIFVGPAARFW